MTRPVIAILYSGLNLVRVQWDRKDTLLHHDVICIAVIHPDNKRFQSAIGHDYYQLIWTDDDCCLTGHDGDYGFFSLTDPGQVDWRFPFIMPENVIEFEGVYVSKEEYAEAKLLFADPDGGMF